MEDHKHVYETEDCYTGKKGAPSVNGYTVDIGHIGDGCFDFDRETFSIMKSQLEDIVVNYYLAFNQFPKVGEHLYCHPANCNCGDGVDLEIYKITDILISKEEITFCLDDDKKKVLNG